MKKLDGFFKSLILPKEYMAQIQALDKILCLKQVWVYIFPGLYDQKKIPA
jgi:hypothetical protein